MGIIYILGGVAGALAWVHINLKVYIALLNTPQKTIKSTGLNRLLNWNNSTPEINLKSLHNSMDYLVF